jgi:hypothetical protein
VITTKLKSKIESESCNRTLANTFDDMTLDSVGRQQIVKALVFYPPNLYNGSTSEWDM